MRRIGILLALSLLLISKAAQSRSFRVSDLPNGSKFGCLNCHGNANGSTRTDFGSDAQSYLSGAGGVQQQHVDWAPLCPRDSDGDGWTNGEELGDPECIWKAGDPNPKGFIFNPGDPDSYPVPVCGNGKLDKDEACEGTLFSKTNCIDEKAGNGTLACTANCRFDYSQCEYPPGTLPDPVDDGSADDEGGCSASNTSSGEGGMMILTAAAGLALMRGRRRHHNRSK